MVCWSGCTGFAAAEREFGPHCGHVLAASMIARSVSWSADSQFLFAAVADTETDIVLLQELIH